MTVLSKLEITIDVSDVNAAVEALTRLAEVAERTRDALAKLGDVPVRVERVGDIEKIRIGTDFLDKQFVQRVVDACQRAVRSPPSGSFR